MTVFSVAGSAWLLVHSPALDVDDIKVQGVTRIHPEEVVASSGVQRGDALLLVPRSAVARRVERIPWVRHAEVRVELPGHLVISVVERQPVAYVRPEGSEMLTLLDETGLVVAERHSPPARTVELRGLDTRPPPRVGHRFRPASGLLRTLMAAPASLRPRVEAIERVAGGFDVRLEGGTVARFGPDREVGEEWVALATLLDNLGGRHVAEIDVRVPRTPTVREVPPPAATPATPTTASPEDH